MWTLILIVSLYGNGVATKIYPGHSTKAKCEESASILKEVYEPTEIIYLGCKNGKVH